MKAVLVALLASLRAGFRSRTALQLEILALRHQLAVYQRCSTRPRTKVADRLLWAWLSRTWVGWRNALVFVQPSTVIAWQRRRFRDHWARLSHARPGRPRLAKWIQDLVREMSSANPRWGSPRIVGELAKLGIQVAKATVERYMVRPKKPPSPTWRAFLANHVKDLVSVDFFVVPTVTFRVLFVFVVLAHARRRIVHFDVTEHPTAQWTAHQISEAFPWEEAPHYLIRDRDRVYGPPFRARVERMGIEEVLTAPRSPYPMHRPPLVGVTGAKQTWGHAGSGEVGTAGVGVAVERADFDRVLRGQAVHCGGASVLGASAQPWTAGRRSVGPDGSGCASTELEAAVA